MHEYFSPQINTLTDRANFVLYGTANAALCIGVEHFINRPKLVAAAFVASSVFTFMATIGHNDIMRRNFPPTPDTELPPSSRELPEVVAWLSHRFGMRSPPPIHVIKEKTAAELFEDLRRKRHNDDQAPETRINKLERELVEAYNKYTNAATYGTRKTGIVVADALMQGLAPKERETVMAHEIGHQAAHHLQKANALNLLVNTASFSAAANFFLTVFSSWTGWMAPVLGFLVSMKSGPLARGLVPESISEKNPNAVANVSMALGLGAMFGVAYFTHNPRIIGAWVAAKSVGAAAKFLNAGYSRCNEYQADRLAAEAVGDPKLAAAGLMKVYSYNEEFSNEPRERNLTQNTVRRQMFRKAQEALLSHPTIEKRVRRLERMARRFGTANVDPI